MQVPPEQGKAQKAANIAQGKGVVAAHRLSGLARKGLAVNGFRIYISEHMTENAFEAIAGRGDSGPLLFLCDHASNALPPGGLGLDPGLLSTHIAYDIGAAAVDPRAGRAYGAPAVLGSWSRLLIDLNRGADDPTLVMKLSDGSIIPGNREADAAEVARRIAPVSRALSCRDRRRAGPDRPGCRAGFHAQFHAILERAPAPLGGRAFCMTATPAWPRR